MLGLDWPDIQDYDWTAWQERANRPDKSRSQRQIGRRRRSEDGRFELMIVTEDDEKHDVAPGPATLTALVALT